jgi:RNA polymerase sigma-70 factor (ECF subfamily)
VLLTSIEPSGPEAIQEAALVRAAQHGDRVAFGALYENYGRLVHGILLAYVPYDAAEDLVQDVFLKALERLPALRNPAAFRSWILTMARRVAIDHGRRRSRAVFSGELALSSVPAAPAKPAEEALAILAVIRVLPASYRETLIFRLVEGMTGPEIAERTGLTPDSVRVNLCRGMKLLRGHLEKHQPYE